MNNIYHRDIVDILLQAGPDGMRLCNIARNIYNRHADLFASDVVYEDIHYSVMTYLWRESQRKRSIFTHLAYGVYAIKAAIAIQLDLFVDMSQEEEEEKPAEAPASSCTQLELFPDFSYSK